MIQQFSQAWLNQPFCQLKLVLYINVENESNKRLILYLIPLILNCPRKNFGYNDESDRVNLDLI